MTRVAALSEELQALVRAAPDLELVGLEQADVVLAAEYADEPGPPMVLVTDDPAAPNSVEAVLPRSATQSQIVAAIHAVAAGLLVQYPRVASERFVQPLTDREVQVLGMLSQGLANKIIAYRLGISEHTVKFHISSIFSKLGVSTRTEAVAVGVRLGLVLL